VSEGEAVAGIWVQHHPLGGVAVAKLGELAG